MAGGEVDGFLGAAGEVRGVGCENERGVGIEDVPFGAPGIVGAGGLPHGLVAGGHGAVLGPAPLGNPSADGKTAVERGIERAAVDARLGS